LHRDLRRNLNQLYAQARRNAEGALRAHHEHEAANALPVECPYRFADLLCHGWYPGVVSRRATRKTSYAIARDLL
jgi:hypothetical protein